MLSGVKSRCARVFAAPSTFRLTEAFFLRLLGAVYLSAFASLWPQISGLAGSRGITPAARVLVVARSEFGGRAFWYLPSLFWLNASDSTLVTCCALGVIGSLLLICAVLPRLAAIACFLFYISLVSVGQPFTSFQWDALLLEAGFLAILAGASWLVWAYRLLLFRLMFESGLVKLSSHDPNWRNLHALRFHFMTQPLPNPAAFYVYWAPGWLLDACTAATLFIELAAPFLLFGPRRVRMAGAAFIMLLQLLILLTGNYAFFNWLTLVLCVWAFDDRALTPFRRLVGWGWPVLPESSATPVLRAAGNVMAGLLILLGLLQLTELLAPAMAAHLAAPLVVLQPLEIVNGYGLFAVMTTSRPELVIEGSNDRLEWREYNFPFKPGNTHRGLPWVAPYQPRLDWQMWFAALGDYQANVWVSGLLYRLMTGEPLVTKLLDRAPFPKPPHYMRVLLYDYTFTTPAERYRTGAVWTRSLRGIWFGPVSLTGQ